MIIRTLSETNGTDRHVKTDKWDSVRLLLERDGMGFSLHVTTLYPGVENTMEYRHHLEAVYTIEGTGAIEDVATGQRHRLAPGVLYALDRHDRHIVRAHEKMVMLCVFNPPVTGDEVHRADGSYAPPGADD